MALVLLLVIGGTFYWVARRTRQQIMEQMYGKAKLVADTVLAQRADDAQALQTLGGRPQDFLHSAEQDLLKTRRFRWRYIYPGNRFETFKPRFNWEQLFLERLNEGRPHKRWDRDFEDPNNGQGLYQLLVPIPAEVGCHSCHDDLPAQGFQGALSVELPFDREQRDLRNTRNFMIVSAIGALVVALVTLYLLMRYLIIEPLHRLKDTTDAVAAGDLEARADVSTGDELEEFANALNHMIDSVQQSHQALAELNLSLDAQLDALGRANLELHEMNQVRTEFLANMSHELRSPLHSVLGFAQILLEETYGPLTTRQRRYVQNMVSSGRDLLHLINNLLEMSRIEAGRMQKNLRPRPLGGRQVGAPARRLPHRHRGGPRRPAPGLHRPPQDQSHPLQPALQRLQVYPRGRPGQRPRSDGRRPAGPGGQRYGYRHPGVRPGQDLRQVPPGRFGDGPSVRGVGSGTGHRAGVGSIPRRRGDGQEHPGRRVHLYGHAATAGRRGRGFPHRRGQGRGPGWARG